MLEQNVYHNIIKLINQKTKKQTLIEKRKLELTEGKYLIVQEGKNVTNFNYFLQKNKNIYIL